MLAMSRQLDRKGEANLEVEGMYCDCYNKQEMNRKSSTAIHSKLGYDLINKITVYPLRIETISCVRRFWYIWPGLFFVQQGSTISLGEIKTI